MILLVWHVRIEGIPFDRYATFENLADAQQGYTNVLSDPCTYSASLCKPFQSTEPHYLES
jgi:hypothetical protein